MRSQLIDDAHFLPATMLALAEKHRGRPLKSLVEQDVLQELESADDYACVWCGQKPASELKARLDEFGDPEALKTEVGR